MRGFRVEPGEVEAVLGRHPAVREAAVVVARRPGDKRLVAFVVPAAERPRGRGGSARPPERASAGLHGPGASPGSGAALTPNGKVDRPALASRCRGRAPGPPPGRGRRRRRCWPRSGPRCWAASAPASTTSFFELGGHSLLATRLMSRVRAAFDVEVPLAILFEAPTVRAFAHAVEEARAKGIPRGSAAPLRGGRAIRRSPSRSSGSGSWTAWSLARPPTTCRRRSISAVPSTSGPWRALWARSSAGKACARFSARERMGRARSSPRWRASISLSWTSCRWGRPPGARPGGGLTRRPGDPSISSAVRCSGPFSFGSVPNATCWRSISITSRATAGPWASWCASWEALRRPLRRPALAVVELRLQYADYAEWQRRWTARDPEGHLGFWRQRLAGLPVLHLPADRPRRRQVQRRGAAWPRRCRRPRRRRDRTRRQRAHAFLTLLTAFTALLARTTGQTDLLVGMPVADRGREIEGLIGFFVNIVVQRTDASGPRPPSAERCAGCWPPRAPGDAVRAGRGRAGSRA